MYLCAKSLSLIACNLFLVAAGNVHADSALESVSELPAQWTLLAGGGYEWLDNDSPSWSRQFVEVSREQKSRGAYRFGVARDKRFANSDITASISADYVFATKWLAGFNFSAAESPDFLPNTDYGGTIGRKFEGGWVANLRARRREYATARVTSVSSVVEKYLGNYRVAYTASIARLRRASNLTSHSLSLSWYYSDSASLGFTVNTGREAEAISPQEILETGVRGISINGRRQLTDRYGLHWWFGLHDQGDIYRRQYVGLAVSIRL